jgi:hypothetical protein
MIKKIKQWLIRLLSGKIDYQTLYNKEVLKRKGVEECLFTLRFQIKACLRESKCNKDYNGKGL